MPDHPARFVAHVVKLVVMEHTERDRPIIAGLLAASLGVGTM